LNAETPILISGLPRLARLRPALQAPAVSPVGLKDLTAALGRQSERPAPLPPPRLDPAQVLLRVTPRAQFMAAGEAERSIPRGLKFRRGKGYRETTQSRETGFLAEIRSGRREAALVNPALTNRAHRCC